MSEYMKQWHVNHKEHDKKYRLIHRKEISENCQRWNQKHPDRYNGNATRTPEQWRAQGYIQRHQEVLNSKCEFCESTENLTAHHPDYDYPTIFATCCASCHNFIHKGRD